MALRMMVLAPLALAMGFAVQPGASRVDFDSLSASKSGNARISSYLDPVQRANRLSEESSREEVFAVADKWIVGINEGQLLPLYPQTMDDSMQTGVKDQILRSVSNLSERLAKFARDEAARGRFEEAAIDMTKSALVFESLKYSDASFIASLLLAQRHSLGQMTEFWKNVPTLTKIELRPTIESLRVDDKKREDAVLADRRALVLQQLWAAEMEAQGGEVEAPMKTGFNNPEIARQRLDKTALEMDKSVTKLYPGS